MLGRLFNLSLSFTKLDANVRAYGQVVYSSFLNLGETMGVDAYVKVLDRQPLEVQQRIRDFLYYPAQKSIGRSKRGIQSRLPTLFPKGFEFGPSSSLRGIRQTLMLNATRFVVHCRSTGQRVQGTSETLRRGRDSRVRESRLEPLISRVLLSTSAA